MPSSLQDIPYRDPSRSVSERVDDLLTRMSLEEKIAQVGSRWVFELLDGVKFSEPKAASMLAHGLGQVTRLTGSAPLSVRDAAELGNTIQHYLVEQTRLGIPAIIHEECCSGLMALGATAFPQCIGLASTWMPELAEKMAEIIRCQLRGMGAQHGLAPVLDVVRDPRWGRTEESFGEDPLLVSRFGVAYIRGLQGANRQVGVLATGKHFIGHSFSQAGVNCAPVHLGQHDLWETWLMPFQAAIEEADVATMMNAYPELDGEVVAASHSILTDLLRKQLGFDGLVVSDYGAIPMIHSFHRMAKDNREAAVLALQAGIDLELPSPTCYGHLLLEAVRAGEVEPELLDRAFHRVLKTKFELGLFDAPYVETGQVAACMDTPSQRELAREIARKSLVLLKNDTGLLPLSKTVRKLAVIGPNANASRNLLGDYSYTATLELLEWNQPEGTTAFRDVDPAYVASHAVRTPSLLTAIQGFVSPEMEVLYAPGCEVNSPDRSGFAAAVEVARRADVVVLALGDKCGFTPDCTSGETRDSADLCLPGVQEELACAVLAIGKPVVIVLINGRPMAIPRLAENVQAILEAWIPGEEGAAAIVETLFGEANPGGKLPITFPRSVGQVPIYYSRKPLGSPDRWYGDYISVPAGPLFPFGHGLSYTRFEYADLTVEPPQVLPGEMVKISFEICNAGERVGDETPQLYLWDLFASSPRPVKELKGFTRLTLQPGETRRVTFCLPVNMLAFYDHDLNLVLEPGEFKVMVGASSEDIRLDGLLTIAGSGKVIVEQRVFACPVAVE